MLKYLIWLAIAAAAVFRPSIAELPFGRLEKLAQRVASHRTATWIGLGLMVLLVRGALLPFWPVPKPVIYDEFAYILQADTFAHGRLANPPHKLGQFFESPYVLQRPTYASKYPPGQALAMTAGQTLFGDPWYGVWLSCGAMVAALVWAMQGWLPAGWALLGGLLVMPLAIDTYWMNSYWGGAVAATGGALVLGGYVRVVRPGRHRHVLRYAPVMGVGFAILANTRPYEGLVFAVPVAIALLLPRPRWKALALVTAVLLPALVATGYYNRAVTGNAFELPFIEYARQYVHIPLFNFQPLQPAAASANPVMLDLHVNWEIGQWRRARTWGLIPDRLADWRAVASTVLGGLTGMLMVLFSGNLWRDRRIRLPLICVVATVAGSLIEIRYYQHYAGPAVAALFIVAVQALRHLRQWKPGGQPAGRFLSRALPILVVGSAMAGEGMVILRQEPPENSQPANARRDQVAANLRDNDDEMHVILVRYTGTQSPHEEWVYNGADIDAQDVVWAHDLGSVENSPLLEYYKGRKIWLLQPDINPTQVAPYP